MDDSTVAASHPFVSRDDTSSGIVVISAATGTGVSYQMPSRSSPIVVENLKNGGTMAAASSINSSQNNVCNGGIVPSSFGQGLVRKVHNSSPNAQKKNLVTLTHLPKRPPVGISFTDISYSVPEGRSRGFKTILKAVNGSCRSGELTAIMGPSGAGKSTLMNILAGYKTSHLSGTVAINGKERNLRRFRKLSCYIMQDDRLMPYLTVKEAMMVSANLKLGGDMKTSAKRVVVEEILEALGLIESSDTKTLHLSGGQRKRLSIALELVNNPPVMFFDEPTSGLDSSSCFQLISLLKSLARGGRTIVCTIHQPSARLFEMFDHLYMLAEGQCMYQGRVGGLVPFLGSLGFDCPSYHNPADYVMEVASGEYGEAVHKLVMAVSAGKCVQYNNGNSYHHHHGEEAALRSSGGTAAAVASVVSNGSSAINDISKFNACHANTNGPNKSSAGAGLQQQQQTTTTTTAATNGAGGGHGDPLTNAAEALSMTNGGCSSSISSSASSSVCNALASGAPAAAAGDLTQVTVRMPGDTVIQMPNNETTTTLAVQELAGGGRSTLKKGSGSAGAPGVTTSLLDSNESVITLPNKGGFPTSGWAQFWILLKRAFLTIVRDQQLTQMRLVSHVIVGAIIGMIYYDIGNEASKVTSNAGCIFFTTLFTMFTAMMPTILTFPMEMAVFIREHLNYWYSLKAFYFAKTLADLPFQILFSSVYVLVVYYLTSQPLEPKRVAMFVFICILTSLVAQSLGLLIGAGLSVEAGVFLGPVSTIPTILFSGFFVNFDTIPGYLQWVTYISYVRYAFEGAMLSIYGMDREKLKCSTMYCHFRNPKKFLEDMSMDQSQYWLDAVALIAIFVVLRVIAYFVLRWKVHSIR